MALPEPAPPPRSTRPLSGNEPPRPSVAAAIMAGSVATLVMTPLALGPVLAGGGTALDAVEAAIVVLEDNPEFNAGRGAALTEYGRVELDASVMDGTNRAAGAVAAVRGVRNPVRAARAVLEDGRHVLLVGPPAIEFAATAGLAFENETWFVTERERLALVALKEGNTTGARASRARCTPPARRARRPDPGARWSARWGGRGCPGPSPSRARSDPGGARPPGTRPRS